MPLHPLQTEWDADLTAGDPLGFPGYVPPTEESVLTGRTANYALIEGRFDVLGGSMGAAHGERVPRKSTSFGPKPRTGLVLRTFGPSD